VKPRIHMRDGSPRIAAVAACLISTGTAQAAMPAAAEGQTTAGVSMAGAGQHRELRYGDPVLLSGRVASGTRGAPVRLEYAPHEQGWRAVARTRTGADGSYRFSLRAQQSGAYRAVADGGPASGPHRVTVVARLAGRAGRHVRRGSRVGVRGVLEPGLAGRTVRLQLRRGRAWKTVGRARTGPGGRFRAAWRAKRPGQFRLRVKFQGDRMNGAVSRTLRGRVYVYRPAHASWYGPGFYGSRTGCGRTLRAGTLGVAHRRLPCGTRVTFRYGRRSVTVPVIDRGPFSGSREWDLTGAAKRRLGFPSTGTVWATK
jgi:rare lipoprotein A